MKKVLLILSLMLTIITPMTEQHAWTKMMRPLQLPTIKADAAAKVDFGYCPGAFYAANEGVGNYYMILTSVPSTYDSSDGSITMQSEGWSLVLDLYAAPTSPISLPTGTYVASEDCSVGTFYPEYSFAVYQDEQGNGMLYSIHSDVKVTSIENGILKVETEVMVNNTPTQMVFVGNIPFTDTNDNGNLLPEFYENLDLQFNGSFAWYYGNLYQANTGNLLVNLYEGDYDKETGGHTGVGYCLQLCLFDILFSNPKNAKVMPGTYTVARNFARDTFYPGMPVDYLGVTVIMGSFCQKHAADGSYTYAFVSDGQVVIEDAGDGQFKFTVDLLTEDGYTIKGTYTGTVPVTDMSDDQRGAVISTLEQDYELTLDGIPVARVWKMDEVNGCGRFYLDIGSPSGLDEHVVKNGGDIFRIDMLTEPGAAMFESGVYTVMEDKYATSYAPNKLLRGFFEDGGDLRGTRWFHFEEGRYMVADGLAPAYDGTVSLYRQENGHYKIDIDVYDDGGFNISGQWTGPIECMFDVPSGIDSPTQEAAFTYVDAETIILGQVGASDVVKIYAPNGVLVKTLTGTGTICLSDLPKGIYMVKATQKKTFKVIKR